MVKDAIRLSVSFTWAHIHRTYQASPFCGGTFAETHRQPTRLPSLPPEGSVPGQVLHLIHQRLVSGAPDSNRNGRQFRPTELLLKGASKHKRSMSCSLYRGVYKNTLDQAYKGINTNTRHVGGRKAQHVLLATHGGSNSRRLAPPAQSEV